MSGTPGLLPLQAAQVITPPAPTPDNGPVVTPGSNPVPALGASGIVTSVTAIGTGIAVVTEGYTHLTSTNKPTGDIDINVYVPPGSGGFPSSWLNIRDYDGWPLINTQNWYIDAHFNTDLSPIIVDMTNVPDGYTFNLAVINDGAEWGGNYIILPNTPLFNLANDTPVGGGGAGTIDVQGRIVLFSCVYYNPIGGITAIPFLGPMIMVSYPTYYAFPAI